MSNLILWRQTSNAKINKLQRPNFPTTLLKAKISTQKERVLKSEKKQETEIITFFDLVQEAESAKQQK